MSIETRGWDAAEHLDTPEAVAAYLEAAFADGDPQLIAAALGDVARSRGMTQIARVTGHTPESLHRVLSGEGNPEFATVLRVLQALGLKLEVHPASDEPKPT